MASFNSFTEENFRLSAYILRVRVPQIFSMMFISGESAGQVNNSILYLLNHAREDWLTRTEALSC